MTFPKLIVISGFSIIFILLVFGAGYFLADNKQSLGYKGDALRTIISMIIGCACVIFFVAVSHLFGIF